MSTNLPPQLLTHLHERLAKAALPGIPRMTGKQVAKLALELCLKFPLAEALTQSIKTLGSSDLEPQQAERICAMAMKLIVEGLRIDDAVSIALHEPAHLKTNVPLPEQLKNRMFPKELTGANVLKSAAELNAGGLAMDDAIIESLRRFAAPRAVTQEQAEAVLDAATALRKEGRGPAEAFDIALRRTLPKHD
jgi:hypothetical protein